MLPAVQRLITPAKPHKSAQSQLPATVAITIPLDPTRVLKSGATLVRQWRGHPYFPRARGRVRMTASAIAPKSQRRRPGRLFTPLSHRGALHRLRRLRGVELPVALFDAASPLEAGNGGADMVRAGSLACSGDFLLRLAICESKHLIAESG